jgi:Domain of unknown function (DUF4440)
MDDMDVPHLVSRWAAAEQDNDPGALDALLAQNVVGVGAAGFVLDREQWTSFADRDVSGRYRLTLTAVRAQEGWRVAAAHIGALPADPPDGAGR